MMILLHKLYTLVVRYWRCWTCTQTVHQASQGSETQRAALWVSYRPRGGTGGSWWPCLPERLKGTATRCCRAPIVGSLHVHSRKHSAVWTPTAVVVRGLSACTHVADNGWCVVLVRVCIVADNEWSACTWLVRMPVGSRVRLRCRRRCVWFLPWRVCVSWQRLRKPPKGARRTAREKSRTLQPCPASLLLLSYAQLRLNYSVPMQDMGERRCKKYT